MQVTRKAHRVNAILFDLADPKVIGMIVKVRYTNAKRHNKNFIEEHDRLGLKTYCLIDHKHNPIFLRFGDYIIEELDGSLYVESQEKFNADFTR